VVGTHAAQIAVGMGANVWVLDRNPEVLEAHWRQFGRATNAVYSTQDALEEHVTSSELVIGGVLVPGAEAPKLVTREMLGKMQKGAVIVDVAIDQGGCFETSHATTHADPTYVVDDVVHYCVANMPGAVPKTSTYALNNVTLPFALALADKGYKQALADDVHLRNGLNVIHGKVVYEQVANDLGYDYVPAEVALGL
jgi:alanine dehydrogenase